jgi:predicted RNA-binding protein YlqC (UPF0109 family)
MIVPYLTAAGSAGRCTTDARILLGGVAVKVDAAEVDVNRVIQRSGRRADPACRPVLSVLLEKFSLYPDEVTASLSKWALSFRFRPDGGISPLLAAQA